MEYALHLIGLIAFTIPNVIGYNLIFGRGKILHFGPLGLSIVASYALFLTQIATGSYALGFLVSVLATSLCAAMFAWLALRLEADALGILTIAMHLAILAVVLNWTDVTRGALGLVGIVRLPFLNSLPSIVLAAVIVAILWIAFIAWLDRGRLGRSLGALAENPWHAAALGISRKKAYMCAFLISGVGAILTNAFYHQYINLVHPSDFSFASTIFFIMCVVAGGAGKSMRGIVIATAMLTLLKEGIRFVKIPAFEGGLHFVPIPFEVLGPMRLVIFGVILIVAVHLRRKELFPVQRTV